MSILAAATIGESLGQELSLYMTSATHFVQKTDRQFVHLWAECEKLAKRDATLAMAYKAFLSVAAGDYRDAQYYVRNIKHNCSSLYAPTLASVLINFGHFAESLESYRQMMTTPELLSPDYFHLGVANGAYATYVEALDFARTKMQLAAVFPAAEADIRAALAILDENGESEELISSAMDIAGDILRERSLMFRGLHHSLRPVPHPLDGGTPYFRVGIAVAVDDEEAFDMTCEYADRLAESTKSIPVSMVLKFTSLEVEDGE